MGLLCTEHHDSKRQRESRRISLGFLGGNLRAMDGKCLNGLLRTMKP